MPVTISGVLRIDPEQVKLSDLPEATAGRRAIALWQSRRAELDQVRSKLQDAQKGGGGLDAMLKPRSANPIQSDALPDDLNALSNSLNNGIDLDNTKKKIQTDLFMSEDNFIALMVIKAKNDDTSPQKQPLNAADWEQALTILTTAQKQHRVLPRWIGEEKQAGMDTAYWSAVKAALPPWRAPADARQNWSQALRARSNAPIIDADLIDSADIRNPVPVDPAFDIWQDRTNWELSEIAKFQAVRASFKDALSQFDAILLKGLFPDNAPAAVQAELKADRETPGLGLDFVQRSLWVTSLSDLPGLLVALGRFAEKGRCETHHHSIPIHRRP